jgi:predicted DNA binding CopG/RHH family protein
MRGGDMNKKNSGKAIEAEAKGLRYQTYIKMLLHEAFARNASSGR